MSPFLVLALPRSRTFWLSHLLGCAHDPAQDFDSKDDIGVYFADRSGVDTALAMIWRDVVERAPGVRICTVRRPVKDVARSVERLVGKDFSATLALMNAVLDEIQAELQCPVFTFDSLDTFEGCAAIHRYCLDAPLSRAFWLSIRHQNLQVDPAAAMAKIALRAPQLRKVFA